MTLQGPARRITIFIGESDRYNHKPLYAEIVHRAHQRGLAGASVFRGLEGFGASSRIHRAGCYRSRGPAARDHHRRHGRADAELPGRNRGARYGWADHH